MTPRTPAAVVVGALVAAMALPTAATAADETPCDTPAADLTLISEVQGTEADPSARYDSPLDRQTVTIRGVVTLADRDLNGYFVQEEPSDEDGDPRSSEGLFVYDRRTLPTEGQTVELTDTVTAHHGLTQLSYPQMEVCDVDHVEIAATPLALPLDDAGREALESMKVTNAQDLQVSGLYSAYRYGELGLALDGPLIQPTSVYAPQDPRAADLAADNAARYLKVNDRNEAWGQFNPYPWERFDDDLSAGDTFPAGRVVGALGYSFGEFKIEPLDDRWFPESDDTDPRAEAPQLAGGNDVGAFNVLNYFDTFGDSAVLRGATNAEDFALQTAKIVDAISRLDAAVLGLVELENDYEDLYDDDPDTRPAVLSLVDALNEAAGEDRWAAVLPGEDVLVNEGLGGGGLGTDAIAVGMIYQPARATQIGTPATFDIDSELTGDAENNRWPLAQTFRIDDVDVTVIVNHFKSKGSTCTDTAGPGFALGDDVRTELTGSCNLVREYAADRVLEWARTKPTGARTPDTLIVGDLNSYDEEGPIAVFEDAGYVDVIERDGDDAFTYKFDGRYGRLDHVLASPSAARLVTDAAAWQINSRAPVGHLYDNHPVDATAFASSDHDPVVVSLARPGRR